jgi:site-specific DNA-methyltransferase (adenine-specific)
MDEIPDNSIDCIITDPPYPKEFLDCYSILAEGASRVLKPGGYCIAYSGHMHLPEVYRRMSEHLEYYWTSALIHKGGGQLVFPRKVRASWKPILFYYKPPMKLIETYFHDVIYGSGREKDTHEWQQGCEELYDIILAFTEEGDTVLEPFIGGGTTAIACANLDRNFIGFEKDPSSFEKAEIRIKKAKEQGKIGSWFE